jgi:SAM-dependent methyltransferase
MLNETLKEQIFDERFQGAGTDFRFQGRSVPIRKGVLRFTPDTSYSTGNFSKLREKHARLQLDSVNGTQDRLKTILERTRWPKEFFEGKLILECGCGAGADTEVLLSLGARVVSVDLAGTEICLQNTGNHPNSTVVQASIDDLPFRKKSFDIVWCHRVLQHTPDPKGVLEHILSFVKDEGSVFVHSYGRTLDQMVSWKYALRPVTRRLDSERLYRIVEAWAPRLYRLTCKARRIRPSFLGRALFVAAVHLVPVRNYRFDRNFAGKDDGYLIEYAIHDTFDALSPRYDSPLSPKQFKQIAGRMLKRPFEIDASAGVTLLRSVVRAEATQLRLIGEGVD